MASLLHTYSPEKLIGRVYTPSHIVEKILDDIGFDNEDILGKQVIDPACGDGQFLIEVARRIIRFSTVENLQLNLSKIHGWDIDEHAVNECINNLNKVISPYNIRIEWNVSLRNSLYKIPTQAAFDFVVGNPPYIRIQHLDLSLRSYLQREYICCKSGSTDAYIAFFELAYQLLSENGICGFITPNSYLYSDTAKTLRNLFITYGCIKQISNFGSIQLFDGASTYSAITVFSKKSNPSFLFEEAYSKFDFLSKLYPCSELRLSYPWQLSATKEVSREGIRLGDIASIHVGITTLCDPAYIFKIRNYNEDFVVAQTKYCGDILIESGILRPIIKASTFKAITTETSHILFPYELIHDRYQILPEVQLKSKFPKAYQYLKRIKFILDQRDNGKINSVAWYAFGRSQGLNIGGGTKIIFPPISKHPTFIVDDSESLFYSGYCIKYNGDNEKLAVKLNSRKMEDYISLSSRDFRGGYKGYNKKVVQEFRIENIQ